MDSRKKFSKTWKEILETMDFIHWDWTKTQMLDGDEKWQRGTDGNFQP